MMKRQVTIVFLLLLIFTGCSSSDKEKEEGGVIPPPETKSVELKFISGEIQPISGEHAFEETLNKSFEERQKAGQVMTVTLQKQSVKYTYDGSLWVPQYSPLKFPSDASLVSLEMRISSPDNQQNGTAAGFLAGDELVCYVEKQAPVEKIEGIKFEHTRALVELTFPENASEGEVITTSSGSKPYKGASGYGVFIPTDTKHLTVNYFVEGKYGLVGIAVPPDGFVAGQVHKVVMEENSESLENPGWDNFRSYTGPFVFYGENSTHTVLEGYVDYKREWNYIETENIKNLQALDVYSSNLKIGFKVDLHDTPSDQMFFPDVPEKILVASDFHGQLEAFIDLMTSQGVMDENFSWTYGTNYVVVNGDTFDRGRDDMAILWLLYKLEKEAFDAGGRCLYLIGNHDDMVLRNNLSYIHTDHAAFASNYTAKPTFDYFWSSSTELGRWVRNRNLVVTVGDDMYVHAGIYKTIVDERFTVEEINKIGKENTGAPQKSGRAATVFSSNSDTGGVLWYRGMARETASDEEIDRVLDHFGVDRVIIGHTEVDDIAWKYDGRVIAVNVKHIDNWTNNLNGASRKNTGALLIENGKYYSVDYKGNIVGRLN